MAGADVTKGALYHHYSGKQALFEAVFEKVESAGAQSIQDALTGARGPVGQGARRGSGRSSTWCGSRRTAGSSIQDGPSVLGYERFREQEERSTFAYVLDIVRAVLNAGDVARSTTRWSTPSPGSSSARCRRRVPACRRADDADAEAERVELAIGFILSGLRALADQGAQMPRARPRATS